MEENKKSIKTNNTVNTLDNIDNEDFTSYENYESNDFDEFMNCLQDIVIEDEFMELRNDFFDKYCISFDENKEENKLEHYDIFKKYVSTIEGYLSEVRKYLLICN